MLLRDFIPIWFEAHSPRLQSDWASTLRDCHLPKLQTGFGASRLEDLTHADILAWYLTEHARRAPMARKLLVTLKQVLADACARGLLGNSPARKVRSIPRNGQRAPAFEMTLKEAMLTRANKRLRPYLLLAFNAPARRRSLLGLALSDVDRLAGTVTYRKTKNGSDVTLPVPPAVLDDILASAGDVYVLPRYRAGSISRAFSRLAVRLGCPGIRFHDTRHDVATRLAEAGVNQSVIAAILGHRDIRSTARYIHPSTASLRVALSHVNVVGLGGIGGLNAKTKIES